MNIKVFFVIISKFKFMVDYITSLFIIIYLNKPFKVIHFNFG
jgi:hypothetical protein